MKIMQKNLLHSHIGNDRILGLVLKPVGHVASFNLWRY